MFCVTFAVVVFDVAVIVWVVSSLSSPSSTLYTNLPNPLGLIDGASVKLAFNFTTDVPFPSTLSVGAYGFTVSIFTNAGFNVHSPALSALSTALTYTNNIFLPLSVFSFTVNCPLASSCVVGFVTLSPTFPFTSSNVYSKCDIPEPLSFAAYFTVRFASLCQSSFPSAHVCVNSILGPVKSILSLTGSDHAPATPAVVTALTQMLLAPSFFHLNKPVVAPVFSIITSSAVFGLLQSLDHSKYDISVFATGVDEYVIPIAVTFPPAHEPSLLYGSSVFKVLPVIVTFPGAFWLIVFTTSTVTFSSTGSPSPTSTFTVTSYIPALQVMPSGPFTPTLIFSLSTLPVWIWTPPLIISPSLILQFSVLSGTITLSATSIDAPYIVTITAGASWLNIPLPCVAV